MRFQKRVITAIEKGYVQLVFNLSNMKFYSTNVDEFHEVFSDFVSSLIVLLKTVQPRGGNLVLIEVPSKQLEVFQLFGSSALFTIKDDLKEAITFFTQPGHFPITFRCPICNRKHEVQKVGKLICVECKAILVVGEDGSVLLE